MKSTRIDRDMPILPSDSIDSIARRESTRLPEMPSRNASAVLDRQNMDAGNYMLMIGKDMGAGYVNLGVPGGATKYFPDGVASYNPADAQAPEPKYKEEKNFGGTLYGNQLNSD